MTHEEQLATIRRICNASGVRVAALSAVEVVKCLAREHAARGAMVAVLERQTRQAAIAPAASMYTSEPIPERPSAFYAGETYYSSEQDARRARIDLEEAQRRDSEQLSPAATVRLAEQFRARRTA